MLRGMFAQPVATSSPQPVPISKPVVPPEVTVPISKPAVPAEVAAPCPEPVVPPEVTVPISQPAVPADREDGEDREDQDSSGKMDSDSESDSESDSDEDREDSEDQKDRGGSDDGGDDEGLTYYFAPKSTYVYAVDPTDTFKVSLIARQLTRRFGSVLLCLLGFVLSPPVSCGHMCVCAESVLTASVLSFGNNMVDRFFLYDAGSGGNRSVTVNDHDMPVIRMEIKTSCESCEIHACDALHAR